MAVCVKYLGSEIPTGQIIFVRGVLSVAVLAALAWRLDGLHLLKTGNWRSHALRSLMGTASMFCLLTAVTLIPLAEFTAITFTAPMFLTILAMLFLGERIHRYRWTALIVGLIGVMIMVGPQLSFGSGGTLGVALTLAAAVSSAFAMMFLRSMSGGGEHAITITFYFSLTITACAALTVFWGWPDPTAKQWIFILLAGLFGVFGQLLMAYSYRYAEASTIAPLDYANLLAAVSYGYFLFDEIPSTSTWLGAPLVIASGLVILWREYRSVASRAAAADAPL
jgi:drug/metabolite transporter (DMT)-like permease